mgnify:CR=1 FL=1
MWRNSFLTKKEMLILAIGARKRQRCRYKKGKYCLFWSEAAGRKVEAEPELCFKCTEFKEKPKIWREFS